MDAGDLSAFDDAHSALAVLRTSGALERAESAVKTAAQTAWTVAKPGLELVGEGAGELLKGFLLSTLTAELDKLAGNLGQGIK